MVELEKLSKTRVGLSDHSIGWELSFTAVALGARVVEKHIVLSRSDGGTDSYFSSEPAELKSVREAMDLSFSILGRNLLDGRLNEEIDVQNSRRSLVALKSIKSGEMVTEFNIGSRRPGGGLAPIFYNEVMRRTAKVDIQKGAPIQLDDLD
jgi:N-acetylneuraminate synthase